MFFGVSGASDGRHLSGDGAADAKAAGGDAAGHERVRQPAAAHHRHLHQRRHIGMSRKPASLTTAPSDMSQISHFLVISGSQAVTNWMFSNAKTPPHCELMASHLRNRITADGAHFELRLHLIYLTNYILHHW